MSNGIKLIRLTQLRNDSAFDELVRNYYEMALRIARQYAAVHDDAHDLVQEAFVTAYERLHQLREPEKFAGWLAVIVRNQGLMWQRRRSTQPALVSVDEDNAYCRFCFDDISLAEACRTARRQVIREAVREALNRLTDGQRQAAYLYYLQGYDYRETAQLLSVPVSAVRGRLERARETLRKELSEMVDIASNGWELNKRDLDAIRNAAIVAASDTSHAEINAILIDGQGRIVSTDLHRVYTCRIQESLPQILIHADLGRILRGQHPDTFKARLVIGENEAILRLDNGKEVKAPLVDGSFPNWEKVIPHEFRIKLASRVGDWLDALDTFSLQRSSRLLSSCDSETLTRTVMVFSPEESTVRLSQGAEQSPERKITWEASFTLPAQFSCGSTEMVLAANALYLEQAIRGLGLAVDAEFEMLLTGDASPFVVRTTGSDDVFVVTMPMQRFSQQAHAEKAEAVA